MTSEIEKGIEAPKSGLGARYTEAFKIEVARAAASRGDLTLKDIAKQFNVSRQSVADWGRAYFARRRVTRTKPAVEAPKEAAPSSSMSARIKELEAEVTRLKCYIADLMLED